MAHDTSTDSHVVGKTWVAFGSEGAIGSIHSQEDGYAVRLLKREEQHGVYPSLAIAKNALQGAVGDDLEFREH
ncbi:hypothetical protein [Planctomonas psychrotolerans]|uniref:hypothetical protein n=1 Tax=Planctomonas psychrotolerans TaxID=2528712 RepID=UPI00123911DF|nr:hypothetical protein [Planctomonas psychrotolerans]